MNTINKYFGILTLLTIISGCGVKEDIEKSVRNEKINTVEKKNNKIFLEKYNAPHEQVNFIEKLNKLPVIPPDLIGTRQEEAYLTEEKNLISQYNFINGWICKVGETLDNIAVCYFDDKKPSSRFISVIGERKYYKNDILSIDGDVLVTISQMNVQLIHPEGKFAIKLIAEN